MSMIPTDDGIPSFRTPEESWEYTRLQNLLQFASATPDQKVEWLAQTLEMLSTMRRPQWTGPEGQADCPSRKSQI